MSEAVRCVRCDYETDDADGLDRCPYCGSDGIPMSPARDANVRVNWHELRILVMWAMNWASRQADRREDSEQAVAAIARRLAHQKPDPAWPGLTMGDDIRELAEAFGPVVAVPDPRGKGEHLVWPGSWTLLEGDDAS